MLPKDRASLEAKGLTWEESLEAGFLCVVLKGYPVPGGLTPNRTDLLVRLPAGYPDAPPDMFWCDPALRLERTNNYPQAADVFETHIQRQWQRFSRHLAPTLWRPGADDLNSYLRLVDRALRESIPA